MENTGQEKTSTVPTIRSEIEGMAEQFKAALPPHIPVERFVRVVMTAINGNPDLVSADRRSLYEAAMKSAQDGLLPDNREAAFVIYSTNVAKPGEQKRWIKKVQYLPMVWGIVKKVRNSGELTTITSHVVHENDEFAYALGDDEVIVHKPLLKGPRGNPIAAYAIAKTKDGGIYREVMTADEIEVVRGISKAKDSGPWSGPFVLEMWRKTVIRRLSKRLPMSTDVEAVIERDDEMYDLEKARDVTEPVTMPRRVSEAGNGNGEKRDEADQRTEHADQDVSQEPPADLQALRAEISDWIDATSREELIKSSDKFFGKMQPLPDLDVQELTVQFQQKCRGKAK